MRDMFRVHVQVTRYLLEYVALMPQGKLNLSQRVAFLTDAPEIESHTKSACCFCYNLYREQGIFGSLVRFVEHQSPLGMA